MNALIMLATQIRHHCRRCRVKLAEPIENPRSAFCCKGCYRHFYQRRCLVCEQEMERTAAHQKLCGSAVCRRGYRDIIAHQIGGKFGAKTQSTSDGGSPSANTIKIGVGGSDKTDRPWRIVAGSLTDSKMHAASLPIDKATAARVDRNNREFSRDAASAALMQRHYPPINLIGGYPFPTALAIDLSATAPITGDRSAPLRSCFGDSLDIPSFLARKHVEP
jgi:hypothetical protein